MAWEKGNTYWKKSLAAKEENKAKLDLLLAAYANGWAEDYGDLLSALVTGKELTKPQIEFMDRFQYWAEFVRPKLARTTVAGDKDNPIQHNITVEFTDNPKS